MRALGLIGGTSWHSTIEYYRYINQHVNDYFGDNTNPPLVVYTLNQALIHRFQLEDNWEGIAELLIDAARKLEKTGVEQLLFAANTPHKVYTVVQEAINTPILHIADATAAAIRAQKVKKVCFIGTKYATIDGFITDRIGEKNIEVLAPKKESVINELHRIIQKELTYGNVIPESKAYVINTLQSFVANGAEGVVLGCTEFPLMIKAGDLQVPIFNTTEIHAKAAANFMLNTIL